MCLSLGWVFEAPSPPEAPGRSPNKVLLRPRPHPKPKACLVIHGISILALMKQACKRIRWDPKTVLDVRNWLGVFAVVGIKRKGCQPKPTAR